MENVQTVQESSMFKAIIMCALTSIGASIIFGVVYSIGYFVLFLSALEVFVCFNVFMRFRPVDTSSNMLMGVLLSWFCVVVTNCITVYICVILSVVIEFSMPFNYAVDGINYLIMTDQAMQSALLSDFGFVLLFSTLGLACFKFGRIKNTKKEENTKSAEQPVAVARTADGLTQPSKNENKVNEEELQKMAKILYNKYYSDCKQKVEEVLSSKDVEKFKTEIDGLKMNADKLLPEVKSAVKLIVAENKQSSSSDVAEQKTLQLLEAIFS